MPTLRHITCLLLLLCSATGIIAQNNSNDGFGKNRVQYKPFDWFYFKSYNFDTYYYEHGKELAAVVGKMAEENLPQIEQVLDYELENRVQIIVYNKPTDVMQTNLGLQASQLNPGGVTSLGGTKLFVYYTGDYADLEKQVRAGIAQVMITELLYGDELQEKLQNSALLNLPDWFIPGLVSYIAEPWSPDIDNKLRDGILSKRYSKLNRLLDQDSRIAGHSIWKFTLDNYASASLSNILYMTRIYRNAETGFYYATEVPFKDFAIRWYSYYSDLYKDADTDKEGPSTEDIFYHKGKKRKNWIYSQSALSPNGELLAYVTNDEGKYKVWLYNIKKKETKLLMRREYKRVNPFNEPGKLSTDPLLRWNPNSKLLAIGYEKKSEPFIHVLNLFSKEKDDKEIIMPMYKYERVLDFHYAADGKRMILSAVKNGQSDLFLFDAISRRDQQLTNDCWDDLYPVFINNDREILFSSNRTSTVVSQDQFTRSPVNNTKDLFIYNLENPFSLLVRATNTPFANETQPAAIDSNHYLWISDTNGVQNLYTTKRQTFVDYTKDTTIGFVDTVLTFYKDSFQTSALSNYSRSVSEYSINIPKKRLEESFYQNGRYRIYRSELDTSGENVPGLSRYKQNDILVAKRNKARMDSIRRALELSLNDTTDSAQKIISPILRRIKFYTFQTEFTPIKKELSKPILQQDTLIVDTPKVRKKTPAELAIEAKRRKDILDQLAVYDMDTARHNFDRRLNKIFGSTKAKIYLPLFSTNYLVTQLDNNLLTSGYQNFTGTGPVFTTQTTNALIKVGTADLFEDYKFTAGFRLDLGHFTIPEYFFSYENLKKRLDKQILFYRQGKNNTSNFPYYKEATYELRGSLKYPFSEISAIRGTLSLRRDELIVLSSEPASLQFRTIFDYHIGGRLEYTFDNTLEKGINLYNGTRSKVYAEYFENLVDQDQTMLNIGFDYRRYEKISRQLIAAFRISGATSLASEKVMYYLGGVDGWLFPRFNEQIKVDESNYYRFQALAGNMRGFTQNIRNGNSNLVVNSELRFPIFTYLLNRPIRSDFVKNFQIIGLGDMGSAWVGANPFSEQNSYNYVQRVTGPLDITVKEPKDPFVFSYGVGLRTRLFGYFIRYDWAYGVVNRTVQPHVSHISLNLDF